MSWLSPNRYPRGTASEEAFAEKSLATNACTFLVDDKPVAIVGIAYMYGGETSVAQAWSYIDVATFCGNYRLTRDLVELSKALIDWAQAEHHLHRLEIRVEADNAAAISFAEHLGFERETGRLHWGGPYKADLFLMARFWE
jgi:RimJ/RimL family protein N-acetyltransferase